jgi:hypothetical protein
MAGTPHVGQHSPTAILDGATSYLNGRTVAGTLQFCTFFALKTRDRVDYLLTRLAGGRPYVLGSKGGYIGLVAAYILVLCLLLWQAAKAVLREE